MGNNASSYKELLIKMSLKLRLIFRYIKLRINIFFISLVVILVVMAAGTLFWKRNELIRLYSVLTIFDETKIVHNFSHMDEMFPVSLMPRTMTPVSELQKGEALSLPPGFGDWVRDRKLTGIVVLKDGQIRHEDYFLGTGPEDLRISWSVAKSFLSVLVGILVDEGAITSIDDPVVKYAPSLAGSAYDGTTIRNVLTMTSGVKFNENVGSFFSDINRMGRALALGQSLDKFTEARRERDRKPGETWKYVSIDTHVIGMVVRGASGRAIPDLMREKLLEPLGREADSYFLVDGHGNAFVLGGLNLVTRDYARFGAMVGQGGEWQGRRIVSKEWLDLSTAPSIPTPPQSLSYGMQWWRAKVPRTGEFLAHGLYGQNIYIDQLQGVVIAVNAVDPHADDPGVNDENIEMFRRIADALQ